MSWTVPIPDVVDGPLVGPDRPLLEGYLSWQRTTLVNICAGLDEESLSLQPIPSTNLSLLGLVRHLAKVERIWLRQRVPGGDVPPLFDPALGRDHDFEGTQPAQEAFEQLATEQRLGDAAVRDLPFDHVFDTGRETWSLRMVYVHLIGEYARHNGHADLIRQAIDGVIDR
jgi:uncharacterized damage-inducible protein DinB